jgi:hypothetical protein
MKKRPDHVRDLVEMSRIADILYGCIEQHPQDATAQQLLADWLASSPHNRDVYAAVTDPDQLEKEIKQLLRPDRMSIWGKIMAGIEALDESQRNSFFHPEILPTMPDAERPLNS